MSNMVLGNLSLTSLGNVGDQKQTVYTLLKSKEQILSTWRTGERSSSSRRVTRSKWPQLDSALFEWVSNAKAAGLDILDDTLREKSLEIAKKLGLEDDFRASNGFLQKFKQRHQLLVKMKE